jgi:alanine racemase
MIRCTLAHVDLAALGQNFRAVTRFLAERSAARLRRPPGIIAVIKANAYGHGATRIGLALEQSGATMLACADIEEGIELRQAGVRVGILVFGALSVSDVSGIFDHGLTPTVSTPSAGRVLQAAAASRGRRLRYHLKIDTGMNRLGFRHDDLGRTLPELLASPNLELEAVATHFATANDPAHPLFELQRRRLLASLEQIERLGAGKAPCHAASSAAILRDPDVWFDFVRPGLLLYGVAPSSWRSTLPLRPVMSLRSRVVAVKGVRPGEGIGYGARFVAGQPRTIAVVPAGYADGLDARLAGRGAVLVRGQRAPIVGSVCMDMLMIDVSGLTVEPGDEVVILGRQGADSLDATEMASAVGTEPYEILCRIGSRIERIYNAPEPEGPNGPSPAQAPLPSSS